MTKSKPRIARLLEAIRAKNWHDANVLIGGLIEQKVADALQRERKTLSEDTKGMCTKCGPFNAKSDNAPCPKCGADAKFKSLKECPFDGDGGSPMTDPPKKLKEDGPDEHGYRKAEPIDDDDDDPEKDDKEIKVTLNRGGLAKEEKDDDPDDSKPDDDDKNKQKSYKDGGPPNPPYMDDDGFPK